MDDDKLYEFIIAYNSTECSIQANLGNYEPDNKYWYGQALAHKSNQGAKYGDIIGWNNQFWGSVRANNAKEALDIFLDKMAKTVLEEHYEKTRRIHIPADERDSG